MTFSMRAGWMRPFVRLRDAQWDLVPRPRAWQGDVSGEDTRVTFQAAPYPALLIREPCRDWSGHATLVGEVYSELAHPVQLILRIDDAAAGHEYADRFQRTLTISPGVTRIAIPLGEVAAAPEGRRLDLMHIRSLALFADHPSEPFLLYLDRLELSP